MRAENKITITMMVQRLVVRAAGVSARRKQQTKLGPEEVQKKGP